MYLVSHPFKVKSSTSHADQKHRPVKGLRKGGPVLPETSVRLGPEEQGCAFLLPHSFPASRSISLSQRSWLSTKLPFLLSSTAKNTFLYHHKHSHLGEIPTCTTPGFQDTFILDFVTYTAVTSGFLLITASGLWCLQ